ncbi:GCN5 family acetyltransferase [Arthrobacter sp. Soil782]|uniref:GNAT family N-acetyltransferase n=1 Tax=Arthrobacter sp. Soil782 TaxID=1736410 RepID=UPI0006FCAE77|nr:GNAT family N-acetyltransferase [Arthrobacter sp. Soil782]KRF08638.1 GCN5 family acetyltransferase [Arthrobacter sp. Soil782]
MGVRPAVKNDILPILKLQVEADGSSIDAEALAPAIDDVTRLVVVAVLDGSVVGWGKTHFWHYADGPAPAGHYLGGVTVTPNLRRRGIGIALTQARLEWIWHRSMDAWYVVNPSNSASIELHRRWGFIEAARAPKFHTTEFTGGVGVLMRAKRHGSTLTGAQIIH